MLREANKAMLNAYVPTCKFAVGVCIRAINNKLFIGCNYENVNISLSLCAEAVAIGAMISAGYTKIEDIVIVADKQIICAPCGACRQRIAEFSLFNTRIHLGHKDIIYKTLTMEELLPFVFKI